MVDLETVQKMWSNSGAPGNYAFSSHLIYPQIAWVQWNGGQEDGAMAIFFIKALWVRSSLKVPMVIQVFKDIPGKLGVLWVTVNLPLTTEPPNTGIKRKWESMHRVVMGALLSPEILLWHTIFSFVLATSFFMSMTSVPPILKLGNQPECK